MNRLKNSNFNIPYIDIDCLKFYDKEAIKKINPKFSVEHNVLPIEFSGQILTVFMGIPTEASYNQLEKETGLIIRVIKTCPIKLEAKIKQIIKNGIEEEINNPNYIG